MKRALSRLCPTLILLILSLGCLQPFNFRNSVEHSASRITGAEQPRSQAAFEDQTQELVGHAERLIEKNEREGAVLDERWYTLKRFGHYQDVILGATRIFFYGGLENDVQEAVRHQYTALIPVEDNQDAGEIRLFRGERERAPPDLIIVGQNGREVALKTIIRLLYLAKYSYDRGNQQDSEKFKSFNRSLKVFRSSLPPQEEFVRFFNRYGISHPDVVMIGFRGDIRALLLHEGVPDPESYADESLRINWYPNARGKKVLLVSIDGNRIYGSRAGALIEAILKISGEQPPAITFLGSAGAIDEPEMIGKIVTPTIVLNGDPFPKADNPGVPAHIVRNKAVDITGITVAHASVENVVVETTRWAMQMKRDRVRTVDQELFYLVNAINSSASGRNVDLFAGILITDNVSTNAEVNQDLTLEHAEETIARTAAVRQEFLSQVLKEIGILKHETRPFPAKNQVAR